VHLYEKKKYFLKSQSGNFTQKTSVKTGFSKKKN